MTILDYFAGTPRRQQSYVLTELERLWRPRICYVINLPVGAGKSRVAAAISGWAASFDKTSAIVTPDSLLQKQYEREFPQLRSVWGGDEYHCLTYRQTCATTRAKKKGNCKSCPHAQSLARAKAGYERLMHLHTYRGVSAKGRRKEALVGYPNVLIVDEAHKLPDFLHTEVKLWRYKHHWPMEMQTTEDILAWIDRKRDQPYAFERAAAKAIVTNREVKHYISRSLEVHHGKDQLVLKVAPLSPRLAKPTLWPRTVGSVILLSATPPDVEETGLDKYFDVEHIEAGSPIPPNNRQFVYVPLTKVTHAQMDTSFKDVAGLLYSLLDAHAEAGMVHVTYGDAEILRRYLTHPRLMWHDRTNKNQIYRQFTTTEAGRGRVLIASGMAEGVDLAGDLARWQVLTKVPFPSLEDPFIAAKAEAYPEWYDRQAVTSILQAYGRVCRGPQDRGTTYCFDSKFGDLYDRRQYMFPTWFKDAVRGL
jgi:Rad3-related DNA helicase